MDPNPSDGEESILRIKLRRDESGYPPYDSEQVLAAMVGDHLYRLTSVPVFAFGLARGDVVEVRHYGKDPWVETLVDPGGHSTVRVVVMKSTDPAEPKALAEALGGEVFETPIPGLLAIDVPPAVDYPTLKRRLQDGREAGRWDYSVGVMAEGHEQQLNASADSRGHRGDA